MPYSDANTAQKIKFPLRISSVNVTKSAGNMKSVDLVTFTEEILNRNFHFLFSKNLDSN